MDTCTDIDTHIYRIYIEYIFLFIQQSKLVHGIRIAACFSSGHGFITIGECWRRNIFSLTIVCIGKKKNPREIEFFARSIQETKEHTHHLSS